MSDLRLGDDGDLYLDADGAAEIVTGADAVRQQFATIIETFIGDWFRDTRVGIDYYELFQNPENLLRFRAVMVQAANLVAGVQSVDSIVVTLDARLREFKVTGVVRLQSGDLANLTYEPPILES